VAEGIEVLFEIETFGGSRNIILNGGEGAGCFEMELSLCFYDFAKLL